MASLLRQTKLGETNLHLSAIGYGASALGGGYADVNDDESVKVVGEAICRGVNYIDTAPWYGDGRSETVLGQALKNIPRDSYYIATKVGRYSPDIHKMFDFGEERTRKSVDESLERLGLQYVDIIQVHDLEFAPSVEVILNETLPALQKIKDAGKAHYIGITGYPIASLREVIERSQVKIDIILSYCHSTLFDNSFAEHISYFQSKGIGIISAAPLGMGLLSERGPPSWHPASPELKLACSQAVAYCKAEDTDISRLALKFSLTQAGDISTTLVSMPTLEQLTRNIEVEAEQLTSHEMKVMQDVIERFFKPPPNSWEGVELKKYWSKIKRDSTT